MMDTYNAFAPSEAEVATYKEKLDNSKAEQKNLFLIIFQVNINEWELNFVGVKCMVQRFIASITDHIEKHGALPLDAYHAKRELTKNETWLSNALERLKEVFLKHEKVPIECNTFILSY